MAAPQHVAANYAAKDNQEANNEKHLHPTRNLPQDQSPTTTRFDSFAAHALRAKEHVTLTVLVRLTRIEHPAPIKNRFCLVFGY